MKRLFAHETSVFGAMMLVIGDNIGILRGTVRFVGGMTYLLAANTYVCGAMTRTFAGKRYVVGDTPCVSGGKTRLFPHRDTAFPRIIQICPPVRRSAGGFLRFPLAWFWLEVGPASAMN